MKEKLFGILFLLSGTIFIISNIGKSTGMIIAGSLFVITGILHFIPQKKTVDSADKENK